MENATAWCELLKRRVLKRGQVDLKGQAFPNCKSLQCHFQSTNQSSALHPTIKESRTVALTDAKPPRVILVTLSRACITQQEPLLKLYCSNFLYFIFFETIEIIPLLNYVACSTF